MKKWLSFDVNIISVGLGCPARRCAKSEQMTSCDEADSKVSCHDCATFDGRKLHNGSHGTQKCHTPLQIFVCRSFPTARRARIAPEYRPAASVGLNGALTDNVAVRFANLQQKHLPRHIRLTQDCLARRHCVGTHIRTPAPCARTQSANFGEPR